LNPYVRAQVFIRKGPGVVMAMDEALKFIDQNSDLVKNGGKVYALNDGDEYSSKETQMIIEGNIQDFVTLETCYLGILSSGVTKLNDNVDVDLDDVTVRTRAVVNRVGDRPVLYFGARHWHYERDAEIAKAAFDGGAVAASTDVGAETFGGVGVGTIPHVLENVYAYKFGKDRAVVEATKAFDKHIDVQVPRVALIDYNNKEIDDALACCEEVDSLSGVRVDTCGENVMQGAYRQEPEDLQEVFGRDIAIPEKDKKFWFGNGVNISGVYALKKALNDNGYENIDVVLTSGFGKVEKVDAFRRAEELLEMKLFDGIGAGTFFHSRAATMDVVGVYDKGDWKAMSKVGREFSGNDRLELRLTKCK
jgi:nicotinate phosphoribosyltransferase